MLSTQSPKNGHLSSACSFSNDTVGLSEGSWVANPVLAEQASTQPDRDSFADVVQGRHASNHTGTNLSSSHAFGSGQANQGVVNPCSDESARAVSLTVQRLDIPRLNIPVRVADDSRGRARSVGALTFADQQGRHPVEREGALETVAELAEPPQWFSNDNKKTVIRDTDCSEMVLSFLRRFHQVPSDSRLWIYNDLGSHPSHTTAETYRNIKEVFMKYLRDECWLSTQTAMSEYAKNLWEEIVNLTEREYGACNPTTVNTQPPSNSMLHVMAKGAYKWIEDDYRYWGLLNYLIEHGGNLSQTDPRGCNAFMHAAGASNYRFVCFVYDRRILLQKQGFNFEAKNIDKRNAYDLGADAKKHRGTVKKLEQLVLMKFIDSTPDPSWNDAFRKSTAGQRKRWKYISAVDNHWNARAPRSSAAQDEPRSSATQDQAEAFSMTGGDQWGLYAAPARVPSDAASSNSCSRS